MSSCSTSTFFLLCCFLSLHACSGRVLRANNCDHEHGSLGPRFEKEIIGSKLQESSVKKVSAMAEDQPISMQKEKYEDETSHEIAENETPIVVEERKLEEQNAAAQETDEADADFKDVVEDDAVVMDYAHPHRKPPIHNEEN